MSKRNLAQLLQTPPEGGHSLEAFDLHNFEYFHSKGGQFNVVSCRETVPNSDYELSVDAVTRSMLCNTANFANIKENWYLIHVPLALICNNAYQMLVQREQPYTANKPNIEQFPVFNLGAVLEEIFTICTYKFEDDAADHPDCFDVHGFNVGMGALRLLDMLGYGCYIDLAEWMLAAPSAEAMADRLDHIKEIVNAQLTSTIYPSVARIGAYQCAWYSFFRNDVYDNSVDASIYNFDDVVMKVDGVDPTYDVTAYRGVHDFVVRNLRLHYVQNKKDMFMGAMPGTQYGACATVPMSSDLSFVFSAVTGSDKDRWVGEGTSFASGQALVTTLADNQNGVGVGVYQTPYTHTHNLAGSATIQSGYSLFDVLTLVESQALQKWRQKSMLAGNKTADQFRAHHGVVPRHLVDHLPDFIGSVDNVIDVSEITSTANTLDASQGLDNLGEIRGRGYGVSDTRTFHFHSDDYGIILLCHSIVAENTYSSYGLDYGNRLVFYSDFFQQEFQNIGLEAVPKFLLDTLTQQSFGAPAGHPYGDETFWSRFRNLMGMYARYYGYKEYTDKVHGLFNPSRLEEEVADHHYNMFGYADMQSFVLPRTDMIGGINATAATIGVLPMTLSRLYQNPRLFDAIFAINSDDHFDTDEFFTKVRFGCNALLPMTKLGLPDF